MRTVSIGINRRCPLKCKHCSVGFTDGYAGKHNDISTDELRALIAAVEYPVYEMVVMVGGEPSLSPSLIAEGISACKKQGLLSAIATAPIWARKTVPAARFLEKVKGLDILILSYDIYHLEFLAIEDYINATIEASSRGIGVVMHIVYSTEDERNQMVSSLTFLRPWLLQINTVHTVPTGNASIDGNIEFSYVEVSSISGLKTIPRTCVADNTFVDARKRVHGCCWSVTCDKSPIVYGDGTADQVSLAFHGLESDPVFRAIRKFGLIDALSPRGKELVVEQMHGRKFTNECHLCMALMREENPAIWAECASTDHAV